MLDFAARSRSQKFRNVNDDLYTQAGQARFASPHDLSKPAKTDNVVLFFLDLMNSVVRVQGSHLDPETEVRLARLEEAFTSLGMKTEEIVKRVQYDKGRVGRGVRKDAIAFEELLNQVSGLLQITSIEHAERSIRNTPLESFVDKASWECLGRMLESQDDTFVAAKEYKSLVQKVLDNFECMITVKQHLKLTLINAQGVLAKLLQHYDYPLNTGLYDLAYDCKISHSGKANASLHLN